MEGRKSWEPISDCMGATHTLCCPHDIKGPAAICQSVTKIDHSQAGNGTLLNWKFSPAALEGDVGRDNLIHLLETYVQRKGMHSQFTVVSKDTLLAAQENPADYKDLLVRVAGLLRLLRRTVQGAAERHHRQNGTELLIFPNHFLSSPS